MAYTNKMRNKFIEMCAKGFSMSEIARELKISLPTLNTWKEETKYEVYELQKVLHKEWQTEKDRLILERVNLLNTELEKAYKALEKIKFKKMKIKNLLFFIERLEREFDDPLLKGRKKPEKKRITTVNIVNERTRQIETSVKETTVNENIHRKKY